MKPREKIIQKLDMMDSYLNELESMLPSTVDDYIENLQVRRACEKTIELAIEKVIEILSSIIVEKRFGIPSSEESIIEIAQKNKVLSISLAKKIRAMKGFRNILVHKYGEVEDEQVFQYFSNELGDFDLFKREILKFVKN
ncbi:MAG TPA: DUF86 domain-containing protein [Candidatus Nanoarchaeia archaeon]|nr:DUF86 domain-containing protein [Candidatus Nanoarchaeia archaeon]